MGGLIPVQVEAVIGSAVARETQLNPEVNLSPNVPLVALLTFLGSVEIYLSRPLKKKKKRKKIVMWTNS